MIRYYLSVAMRNVARNKGFAFLNIAGFALGLSTFLMIVLFVTDELSYDRYNAQHEKTFRVDTDLKYSSSVMSFAIAAPPVAEAMAHNFAEVKAAARIDRAQNIRLKKGTEVIQEDRVVYADQSLFEIFSFNVLDGSIVDAISGPGSIVITESIAEKYFGSINVSGKTITIANNNTIHTIRAVVEDMPSQSHFHADLFLPLVAMENSRNLHFNQFSFNTYVLLNDESEAVSLMSKLPDFLRKHLSQDMNVDDFEKGGNYIRLSLTPLDDIHLHSNRQRELEANSDVTYVYIFTAIAMLILGLACINFVNLFTARSANRAREVGVRKVLGSARASIMVQFLFEAFIMTAISAIVAVVLAFICLPAFNTLSGKNFEPDLTTVQTLFPVVIAITFVVALAAGFYPAFYLSSFEPVKVLKGRLSSGFRSSRLRSILVVIQFSIATFLVVGTLVILQQLEFIQSKNIGFERQHVLIVNNVGSMNDPLVMKNEAKQITGVVNASLSGFVPTGSIRWQNSMSSAGHEGSMVEFWNVDTDYINTLEMKIIKGRNFSNELASDSSSIILNESAAKTLDLGTDPLEKKIEAGGKNYTVIGIVKDFNFSSLRENVTPLVMALGSDWHASLMIRTAENRLPDVLDQVKTVWKKMNPGQDFEYSIMDEDFEAVYVSEQRMKTLFTIFSVLAIIIAGVGLFGLSAYAAEQRTRELSIRKILGATAANIFNLMTLDFLRLILIAVIIALPSGWWMMGKWLEGFANRIEIPVSTLFFSAVLIVVTSVVTISYQTVRAALNNPVDDLRSE